MQAFRIVIGVVTLIVFGFATVFVYRRLVRDTMKSVWMQRLFGALLIGLFLAVPFTRWVFTLPPPDLTVAVLFGWGVFMYTLMALLVIELAVWLKRRRAPKQNAAPENPERRLLLSRAAATSAVFVGTGATAFGSWRAFNPPEITEVPVKIPGLPKALEGFTIAQLSDIHVGAIIQEKFLDQLVATTNSARPDLTVITGDLVDGKPDLLGRYVARLRNLQSRYGTHFVSGNHDYYSGWEEWAAALQGIDFKVLRNRFVTIGEPGASFDLVGVDDWGARWAVGGYDLETATKGRDPHRPSVLLAHQPNGLELASAKGISLQLSGHTHGGQMFPANLIGDAIWGSKNTGLSKHLTTQLYTSRGCGFVGPPVRLGAPPEVVKIVLLSA
ncbi:MAG: metallophosphoesterase [Archangium sp.]